MAEVANSFQAYTCLMSVYTKEAPENLRLAIDSILAQTIPPEEFLIIKDGPLSDPLEALLSEYDSLNQGLFTFVAFQQNQGLWRALEEGVIRSRNELILRMDSDDYSVPDRAAKELGYLKANPCCSCVGSLVYEFVGSPEHTISLVELPEHYEDIVRFGKKRNPIRHPTLLYKRSAVLAAGNYREMPFFEDYDIILRLISTGANLHNIQEPLVYMRTSDDFFERRGGVDYLRKMLHFRKACLKSGLVSTTDFVASVVPHAIVCLMPNALRSVVYRHLLRKKPE